jgi:uncharacterized protein (UPF0333 family)
MRGSVSLDFLLALVVLFVLSAVVFGAAVELAEDSVASYGKLKAESLAMAIGSSINRFYATNPGDGSQLVLDLQRFADKSPNYFTSGFPGVIVSTAQQECKVNITTGVVYVRINMIGIDSNDLETVVGSYPVVDKAASTALTMSEDDCTKTITASVSGGTRAVAIA